MHGAPPRGVPPARLFRLLLRSPRPCLPLQWRAPGAEWAALHVVALRGIEVDEALDAARAAMGEAAHFDRFRLAVLRASLRLSADGAPVFASVEDAGALQDGEAEALLDEVFVALGTCSPTYARSDLAAWDRALREGARAPGNLHETVALGSCIEHGWAGSTPRPDLYYGVPIGALTDGQMMAYRAARAVVADLQRAHAPSPGPRPR